MINYFRIGKITTLHGIKGEVKVYSTSSRLKRFDDLKDVYLAKDTDGEPTFDYTLKVSDVKYVHESPILKFEGYDSIEASTHLINYSLYVKREDAIKTGQNEYYEADLLGLKVFYKGEEIGKVEDILDTKANSILSISYGKKNFLVPLVYDYLEKVDIDKNEIYLKNIEGLL